MWQVVGRQVFVAVSFLRILICRDEVAQLQFAHRAVVVTVAELSAFIAGKRPYFVVITVIFVIKISEALN